MVELLKLEIEGFGKFAKPKVITFKKGINFITGLNESGKSTLLESILASIFKYTSPKIHPFFSWKNPDICRVALTYKTDKGQTFRVSSDYKNGKRKLEKITKGKTSEISSSGTTISEYIKKHFGFNEQKVFENTTFIRQSQMAIAEDSPTKNKIRDMVEEVLVGTAEASATKSLKKIKKVEKDSKKEIKEIQEELYETKGELEKAEESKEGITKESEEYEEVSKELSTKSEKLKKLKENKKLFDEKEKLQEEAKHIEERLSQIDEMVETLKEEKEEKPTIEQNKTLPIILIVVGIGLSLTGIGAIIGIPLIIYGIYLLVKAQEETKEKPKGVSSKIPKYQNQKKDLINKKAVNETKLEKYKLVKFTIDNFKDLDKLEGEVSTLENRQVELKTGISKTKELVKSPEDVREEVDSMEQEIDDLKEKAEEHQLASKFLEMAETKVHHKFTPSIEKDSKPLLKEVTDDKYSNLKVDEETLDVTIKAPEIKEYVPVDVLSQGAKDQVYFAVRTTMSDLLSGDINIPLIFDDPFHNFDNPRLKKTIDVIKKIAKTKQIILISHKPYQKTFKNFAGNVIEVK